MKYIILAAFVLLPAFMYTESEEKKLEDRHSTGISSDTLKRQSQIQERQEERPHNKKKPEFRSEEERQKAIRNQTTTDEVID